MSLNLMGKKRGMTRIYDEQGNIVVCTVIQLEPNVVVQEKEYKKGKAIQLGAEKVTAPKLKNVKKPLKGHFAKANVEPRRYLSESVLEADEAYEVGQEVGVEYFDGVPLVDVCGVTKGKGFQGVMKRHNFAGGPAAHGSGFHRTAGSTGMNTNPGRTLPGTKMAGHMGHVKQTTERLHVVKIDAEKSVLLVKGAVPGPRGGLVSVRKAVKRPQGK